MTTDYQGVVDSPGFAYYSGRGSKIEPERNTSAQSMVSSKIGFGIIDNMNQELQAEDLTATERALYNYYLGATGPEAANKYLDIIRENRKAIFGQNIGKTMAENNNPVLNTAFSFASGLSGGVEGLQNVPQMIARDDEITPIDLDKYATSGARPYMGKVEGAASDMAYSVGNMIPSMVAGATVGPGTGAALMGLGAAANTYQSSIHEGNDPEKAQAYAALNGVMEGGLQYALGGISKLGKYGTTKLLAGTPVAQTASKAIERVINNPVAFNVLKKMGGYTGSMVSEGFEEYLQTTLDPVIRNVTLDENNEFKPFTEQALYDGIIGALTAGVLEVAPNVASDISSIRDTKIVGHNINESGTIDSYMGYRDTENADTNSELYKMAEYVAAKQQAGKKVSDIDAGSLASATFDAQNSYSNPTRAEVPRKRYGEPIADDMPTMENEYTGDIEEPETWNREPATATPENENSNVNISPEQTYQENDIQPYAEEYSGHGKQAMIDNYDGTVAPEVYSKGYFAYYGEGRHGMEYGQTHSLYGEMMPEQARMAAYEAGVADRNAAMQTQAQPGTTEPGGLVSASDNATDAQKTFTDIVGKKTGLKFEIVDSMPDAYGEYNKGTVKVALDSKNFAGTVSHELTHYIKDYAPQDYQAYQDIAVQAMMQSENVKYDDLVETYLNRYRQVNDSFTKDDAVDEIVADATERFFSDDEYINNIVNENKTLGRRILDFLNDLVDSIKQMVKSIFPENKASQAMNENLEKAQMAQELWYMALDSASINKAKGSVVDNGTKYQLNEFGLEEYNDHEKQGWENSNIITCNTQQDIIDFVNSYVRKPGYKRLYMGKIGESLANKIKKDIGLNLFNYNVVLTSNLEASHASYETEAPRGQIAVTPEILAEIPEIIAHYDSISLSGETDKGKPAIKFEKNINGQRVVIEYVSDKRKMIYTQTMYARAEKNTKKGSLPATANVQALALTPETKSGTASTDSISSTNTNIKNQLKDVDYMGDYWFEEGTDTEMNSILQQGINLSKGIKINDSDITRIANKLLKSYNSSYDKNTLTQNLKKLFYYMESGESIDSIEVASAATSIAKSVLEQSSTVDNTLSESYKDLKDQLKTTKIQLSDQDKADLVQYGGYNSFRKQYFGKLKLGNEGISVDTLYQELLGQYPELFGSNVSHPADRLITIADVVDSLQPAHINQYGANSTEMAAVMSYEIFEDYFATVHSAGLENIKEQYTSQLSNMKNQLRTNYERRLSEVRNRKNKERTYERQYLRAEYEQGLSDEKKKQRELLQEKREALYAQQLRYQERIKKSNASRKERQSVKKYKTRLMKNVMDMKTWLLKPTETKHVPEELRRTTAEFLSTIDFSSNRLNKYGEPTRRTEQWNKLKEEYKRIAESSQSYESGVLMDIDPDFVPRLEEFIATTKQVQRLEDMNSEQLKDLDLLVGILKHTIQDANKLIVNKQYSSVSDIAKKYVEENISKKNRAEFIGWVGLADKLINLDMVDSRSFFHGMGLSADTLYSSLRNGLDTKIRKTQEVSSYMQKLTEGVDLTKWTGRKAETREFIVQGKTIQMTPSQVMSLYLLNKREQAQKHLYGKSLSDIEDSVDYPIGGGIRVDTIIRNGRKEKMYEPVQVTPMDVSMILNSMTDDEIRVANGISTFLSRVAEWGNEVSLLQYGYKKFMGDNYFPIVVDNNLIATNTLDIGGQGPTLKNLGFTKSTNEKANNALVIQDIFDVFSKHVDQMASYNAFVLPLSDLQKFLNYKDKSGINVKRTIERTMGEKGKEYIIQLMQDVNGLAKAEKTIGDKLVSNMKAAAVGANLRVVIQQPTSWMRAMAEMDPKYLFKGLVMKGRKSEIMKEYAPIARWKDWGFFEMDTGRQMKDIIMGSSGIAKFKEYAMTGAQWADNITWERLWNAAEAEVMDTNKMLMPGSEAFYEVVGSRFSEIIDKTQVVDSILHRSQMMRSKNATHKMTTSFMSEPMKTYNMLRNAYIDVAHTGSAEAKRKAVRVSTVFLLNSVATALAAALIDMLRDDDSEKSYGEKYKEALVNNIIDNVAPWNYIPYLKDAASLFTGYSVTRMDMSAFEDIRYTVMRWNKYFEGESPYTIAFLVKDTVGSMSKLTGIPVKNLMRDVDGFLRLAVNMLGNDGLAYVVDKSKLDIKSEKNVNYYAKTIVESIYKRDTAFAKRIYNDMVKAGFDNETLDTKIGSQSKKALKSEPLIADLFHAKEQVETEEVKRLISELESLGYKRKWIQSAVESYGDSMYPDEELDPTYRIIDESYFSEESEGSYYTYDMLFNELLENGYKSREFKAMLEDMEDNGKEEKTVMAAMKARATKELMPEYVKARDAKDYDTWQALRKQLLNIYRSMDAINEAEKSYRKNQQK